MYYFKTIENGYIVSIGSSTSNVENAISKKEYDKIYDILSNPPKANESTYYKLKSDLTWDALDFQPAEEETTIEDLKKQVDMLTDCIMEMADIIYA